MGAPFGTRTVAIYFQSLRSSSAGNCLALWTATSSIFIDCGIKVQRECREMIEAHRRRAGHLDAVIVSHAHGDHMAYGSLRVLGREGIRVLGDGRVVRHLREWHEPQAWKEPPRLEAFPVCHRLDDRRTCGHLFEDPRPDRSTFDVGDFRVMPIEVPHAPHVPTFGFAISARDRGTTRHLVFCTDFHDYAGILPYVVDADFVFVEANHDLELLRQHPNHASRYHLDNMKTASLLHDAARQSVMAPGTVMLGHLSEERNRRALALDEVTRLFARHGTKMRFHLDAAPARRPSAVVEI
jgi:ribonuclease BN (tRNA processing enzyme)